MHSRVNFTNNDRVSLVSIRPPDGRLIGLIAFFGLLLLIATSDWQIQTSQVSSDLFYIFPVALLIFVALFNVWQFFW